MPNNPYEWFPGSSRSLHSAAAEAIRQDPDLISDALKTLEHWLVLEGRESLFLSEWKNLLVAASESPAGLNRLLSLLEEDSEWAAQMKSYSPVATILDRQTIDQIYAPRPVATSC